MSEKYYVCIEHLDKKIPRVYVTQNVDEVDLLPGNAWGMDEIEKESEIKRIPVPACLKIYNNGMGRLAERFENNDARLRLTFQALPHYAKLCQQTIKPWEKVEEVPEKEKSKRPKGLGPFIVEHAAKGLKNAEILELLKVAFPESALVRKDAKNISWYRTKFKAEIAALMEGKTND